MEIYAIRVADDDRAEKFILYRPLTGLAFVGNRAMADLALAAARGEPIPATRGEAIDFLRTIGFLDPDPPPPPPVSVDFRPTTAVLLLTNQCQLRCTYCYAAAGELPRQELSVELGSAAIDYVYETAQTLKRSQFEVSFHGGGEPTVAWKVLQACTACARQKLLPAKVTLTSNGVWSPKQCEWIVHNLDGLSLSLDGDPETQDRQRPFASGRGSSARIMRTVAELDRHSFPYGIRMTATAPWGNLPTDVRFLCGETDCQSMQVEPAFNTARGGHGRPSEAEGQAFVRAFMEASEIASRAGRRLFYSGARMGVVTSTFCTAPYGALIVNGLGELVACYEVSGHTHPLARLSTVGRIEDGQVTVDEAARARLHRLMAERREACRDCFCHWSCAGDCYTRTFRFEPGGHLRREVRCHMNQSLTQQLLLRGIAAGNGVWHAPNRLPARNESLPVAEAITI